MAKQENACLHATCIDPQDRASVMIASTWDLSTRISVTANAVSAVGFRACANKSSWRD